MVRMMTMMMMAVMMIGTFIELYGHSEWLWWLKTFPFLVSTTSSFSSLCFIWWSRLLSCPTLTVMIITFIIIFTIITIIINIIVTTSPLISSAKLGLVSEPSTFTMVIWWLMMIWCSYGNDVMMIWYDDDMIVLSFFKSFLFAINVNTVVSRSTLGLFYPHWETHWLGKPDNVQRWEKPPWNPTSFGLPRTTGCPQRGSPPEMMMIVTDTNAIYYEYIMLSMMMTTFPTSPLPLSTMVTTPAILVPRLESNPPLEDD